jgi:carbonic anhydrase/acetyltransferase-like protein (isoleucine patch superfamily)
MTTRPFEKYTPLLGQRVFVDEMALVIGRVSLGDDVSIWPMTVVRGDVDSITIGARTNIQDNSVLHVTHYNEKYSPKGSSLTIGTDVTVGHRVILHACTVGNRCLIGMGSIILDDAIIEDDVMIGAGTLVPRGRQLKSGYLYLGSPAKEVRLLTEEEKIFLAYSAQHYVELKNKHKQEQQ